MMHVMSHPQLARTLASACVGSLNAGFCTNAKHPKISSMQATGIVPYSIGAVCADRCSARVAAAGGQLPVYRH